MIKSIRKDSRISKRNIMKVSSIVKNCLRFVIILVTVLIEEHLRNGFVIEYFLLFGAIFKCGRIIY